MADEPSFLPIESSNIASVAYDADAQELNIQFRNGRRYTYLGVPAEIHDGLWNAPSPGGFLRDQIIPNYAHRPA